LKVIEGEKIRYGKKNDFGEPAYPGFPSICYSNPIIQVLSVRIEAAPRVAELMAQELKRDGDWQKQTVRIFKEVAQGYLPPA
jgi:hypothetical protein